MADWDISSPGDSDIVSQFPANERAARTAVRANFGVEHHEEDDANVGKHERVTLLDLGSDPTIPAGQVGVYNVGGVLKTRSGGGAAVDVATETYVDNADAAHAALTAPHSATSAATANRLMLRDAAGRAKVADPSVAADIATKGYADSAVSSLIPPGTRMVFRQASAPTGWTQDTSLNDRVLRMVSGSGGGAGGSWLISGLSHAHTHDMAHTHETPFRATRIDGGSGDLWQAGSGTAPAFGTGTTRAGQRMVGTDTGLAAANEPTALTSGASVSTTTGASTSAVSSDGSWRPLYADVIVASKN